MSVLLISNGAPGYHYFFNALLQEYAKEGRQVVIAVDCPYSKSLNELDSLGFPIHVFSEFYRNGNYSSRELIKYSEFNLNAALLSDFERNEVYGIARGRGAEFYELLASALIGFYENIFDVFNVSEVVYEGVSNTFAHFAYFVAQRRGAVYKGLISSRLPGRYSITSDPCNESFALMREFHRICDGEVVPEANVKEWCISYLEKLDDVTPDYMKFNKLDKVGVFSRYLNFSKLKKAIQILKHQFDDHEAAFQIGNPLRYSYSMVKRNFLRRVRLKKVVSLYDKPSLEGEFYLYPLHFHPEASTSILSGAYLDEYEVIRNIAFNLPSGIKLFVKDHVSAYGFQSLDFYKRIKLLPNVLLLGPHEHTKSLIRSSSGVITLTSTVGYEALLLNKRVFLFGRVFYEGHKNVRKVADPAQLFELLKYDSFSPDLDAKYNIDFLCAYYAVTRPGVLNLMGDAQGSKRLAQSVYKDIRDYTMESG